jgi:hypothetical protein
VGDDNNTITFNALADGAYDNCTVSVTNNGIRSDNLSVSSFTIDTIAPVLLPLDNVTTLTNDNTSLSYTFSSTEGGTITVGGNCSNSSDNNTAVADNMTVSFAALADGNYANCTITVTDSAGNTEIIEVNTFTIDTIAPTLAEVTPVEPTPTNDNTSSYTFSTDQTGTIAYSGGCSSSTTAATAINNSATNNAITFNALADGNLRQLHDFSDRQCK